MHIDAEVVGCDALAVEGIDAADLAEVVPRGLGVELVLGEGLFAGQEAKLTLVHFDHERVLAQADGTVAHGQFGKVCLDLEAHGTAVTRALVLLHWTRTHDHSQVEANDCLMLQRGAHARCRLERRARRHPSRCAAVYGLEETLRTEEVDQ